MYPTNPKAWSLALLSTLAVPINAYWRMPCPGTLLEGRLDPIVSPGKVSGHTHVILGGNGFAPSMDYASTQASTCTSCDVAGDNSNYWVPKLYFHAQNGSFIDVPLQGTAVYYEQRMKSPIPGQLIKAFPKGFRMTAGNPELRTFTNTLAQAAVTHACIYVPGPETNELPAQNCPGGVRSQIYFPSCWDGVNLDSEGHQCHMSYPTGDHYDSGECPTSHPYPLISIFYEFLWDTNAFKDEWYGNSQPFVYAMGDATGYGFHADFVNGWDVELLQYAIDNFNTNDSSQAENIYFNNFFKPPQVSPSDCSLPQLVDEQINGVLNALPGCNPVTNNPGPVANCAAPTTLAPVTSNIYTDMTAEGWEYLGCGVDTYGNPALGGNPLEDSPSMTVETCTTLCGSKGFPIAGLEYSSQCFCGNTLPARASPTPGSIGDCDMPCKGNSNQLCGAGSRLSLYQKCTGTCTNAQFGLAGLGVNAPAVVPVPAPSICGATAAPTGSVPVAGGAASSSVPVPISSPVGAHVQTSTSTSIAAPKATGPSGGYTSNGVIYPSVAPTPPAKSSTASSPPPPVSSGSGSSSSGNSSVTLPSGWTSAGCYSDAVSPRSLSGITFAYWGQEITSSGCCKYCDDEGYSYAGTEYSGQCFCGNELVKSEPKPSTDCDMPCDGSATEICGGPARLSVFKSSKATRRRRSAHLRRHGVQAAS